ncbi:MAG TPA: type II secretion system F family protein [Verrucomicrobiae bacterium]|jgi:type IV pilus assembly protein PilC|nr:type II secretion system F family protein [Verrucomicrobiae bacterium]
MPLIITPGQLRLRSELYHQLGVTISAGLTVPQALEHLIKNPPARSMRPMLAQWQEYLLKGHPVVESLRLLGSWTPSFDLALLEAGEQSGRLDACFKLLATYYQERAQMVRQVISDMLYPLFIFHCAIVIFAFVSFMKPGGTAIQFAATVLGVFVPLYAAAFFLVYACQGRRGEHWRAMVERVLHPIPILGTARRYLALARLAAALEALLNAGVGIIGAWELAATASGSPALRHTVQTWKIPLEEGATPAQLVSDAPQFPDIFRNLYHTGETSGKLDETLDRIHKLYQEEGSRKLHAVAQWTPRLIYYAILIFVGYKIIASYSDMWKEQDKMLYGK